MIWYDLWQQQRHRFLGWFFTSLGSWLGWVLCWTNHAWLYGYFQFIVCIPRWLCFHCPIRTGLWPIDCDPLPYFHYSLFFLLCYLHLVNWAAISCNQICNKHLSGAWALIALLTCCRVIALTQTNGIHVPICRCLLSPACIAPSRLRWLSALFDLTHSGQNFRGLLASNLIPNEIDVF